VTTNGPDHATPRDESIYIHGSDRLATSALAVGLALRSAPSFAWADCADPALSVALLSRAWVERRAGRPVVERVDPPLLRPANLERVILRHTIVPVGPSDEGRLLDHLAMPELFQRLAARAISGDGHGVIFIANVDALSPALRANTVEMGRLHRTLHAEGLTVIVTSRGGPSTAVEQEFDRIYRVEVPANAPWVSGTVTEEKSTGPVDGSGSVAVTKTWERLGLDPSLLSPS